MADRKISQFENFTGDQGEDVFYVVASGITEDPNAKNYKVPFDDLAKDILEKSPWKTGDGFVYTMSPTTSFGTTGDLGIYRVDVSGDARFREDVVVSGFLNLDNARSIGLTNDINFNSPLAVNGTIKYKNSFLTEGNLPSASEYNGMFAKVTNYNNTNAGKSFFSHAGAWHKIIDSLDLNTQEIAGSLDIGSHLNPSLLSVNQDIVAVRNIEAGLNISGFNFIAINDITAGEDIAGKNVSATNDVTAGQNVTATAGSVSAGTTVSAGTNVSATNDVTAGQNITATNIQASNDITGVNNVVAGQNLGAGNDIEAANNITAGENIGAGNDITGSRHVIALQNIQAGVNVNAGGSVFSDNHVHLMNSSSKIYLGGANGAEIYLDGNGDLVIG
jgi:hypothetical protein